MESKPRILIVDDEDVVLDSCTQILAGRSYEVKTASDGNSGVASVQEFPPDLVFVDLKMPGMSGFEVLEAIHAIDPTIVTIVITGFATISSAVDAMKRGAYDFLPKPFMPEELRLIAARGLEKRRLTLETLALRREKEKLREHFAHIVSHELRAPLSAVQQSLYAMEFELGSALGSGQKETFQRIKTRIGDLLKLIESWLRLVAVDAVSMQERFVPVALATPIESALQIVANLAARKGLEIHTSIAENVDAIHGDNVGLSEVFVNILGNAIKYSHDGGRIVVQAGNDGDQVMVSIQDSGIGIAPSDMPHLFEGFYRGSGQAAAESGHGIGLAVSRQIVEAHRGSISVESEPGVGTTFFIRFPKCELASPLEAGSDAS